MSMEFGKLSDISGINWKLPEDDPKNKQRFSWSGKTALHLGSPAWGNKHWRGKIYPREISPDKFLSFYSRQFDCIELNTTHYRIPTEQVIKEWVAEVPTHFQFCPKVFNGISHSRVGLLDKTILKTWISSIQNFGDNLGPCFIQLHELFSYSHKADLFRFLENWPSEFKLSLELRHSSWFEKNKILSALTDYLCKRKIGLVITDVAGRRDVLHSSLSSDWVAIRLIGNNLEASDEARLADWAQRLVQWKESGAKDIYVFLHQPDDDWTIEFARLAQKTFSKCGFENLSTFELVRPRDLFSM